MNCPFPWCKTFGFASWESDGAVSYMSISRLIPVAKERCLSSSLCEYVVLHKDKNRWSELYCLKRPKWLYRLVKKCCLSRIGVMGLSALEGKTPLVLIPTQKLYFLFSFLPPLQPLSIFDMMRNRLSSDDARIPVDLDSKLILLSFSGKSPNWWCVDDSHDDPQPGFPEN